MARDDICRTGLEAWNALGQCGLELKGRDHDLADALRHELDRNAPTLQQALSNCTTEQFVRSFLAVGKPFVRMLSGILRMFELASAKHGPAVWRVAFDDYEETVEHFKEWERVFDGIGTQYSYPLMSQSQLCELTRILRDSPIFEAPGDSPRSFCDRSRAHAALRPPAPDSPRYMLDLWALIMRAQQLFADAGLDLITAGEGAWTFGGRDDLDNELNNLRSVQHDWQVSQLVTAYESLSRDAALQRRVCVDVQTYLENFPRRTFFENATIDQLEPFLSLPVWQKRNEFYAAWIASEQIDVLRDLGVVVHSKENTISFPFRPTVVATLPRAALTLMSERRIPLTNPIGAGRKGNVQPDFSWWDQFDSPSETCPLVVEVKHFKKAPRSSWADVLIDYADAHPRAQILLVNYGAGGNALADVPVKIASSCHVIGNLHPDSPTALASFRELVVKATRVQAQSLIFLDISSSMNLPSRRIADALKELAMSYGCQQILAVDNSVADTLDVHSLEDNQLQYISRGQGEAFAVPLLDYLEMHSMVILVSDDSGARSVEQDDRFRTERVASPHLATDLYVIEISKKD